MPEKRLFAHSVELDIAKCTGCTTCLKHCPTEAIRIRDGHACIDVDRCIDCGECIRLCPHGAKKAMSSKLEHHLGYKYKIALPPPSLFGQFEGIEDVDVVLEGLLGLGFDDVFEVGKAAEFVTEFTRLYIKRNDIPRPVISSACPAIVRLISSRYPSLMDNLIPILPPVEVASIMAKKRAMKHHPELKESEIATYFISPCPAKVSYIRNGFGSYKSNVDVALSMKDIYFALLGSMKNVKEPSISTESGMIGFSWAGSGGESSAIMNDKYLAADGIDNVSRVLEAMDNDKLGNVEFVELNACVAGCVGGVMTIENPFIAKTRLQTVRRYLPVSQNRLPHDISEVPESFVSYEKPNYEPVSRLSNDFAESMRKMKQIMQIKNVLPGIDCGACGSPTCRAFAEDLVRGNIKEKSECPVYRCNKEKQDNDSK